jgi:membrane protein
VTTPDAPPVQDLETDRVPPASPVTGLPIRLLPWVADSLLLRIVNRFVAIQGIDMAFRLAAQAFISLIPLMVVAAFLAPIGGAKSFQTTLINLLGLHGAPRNVMQGLAGTGRRVGDSLTAVGLLVILYSALSFTRTFRRVYERAWSLPKRGLHGIAWDVMWLASLIAYLAVLSQIRVGLKDSIVSAMLALFLSSAFWVWTARVLLANRVPMRNLVPTGVVMAVGMIGLAAVSQLYMPHLIVSKFNQFGQVGVVFAVLSWFIVVCFVLVGGACTGAVVGEWLSPDTSQASASTPAPP